MLTALILDGCRYARPPRAAVVASPPTDSVALVSVTQLNGSEFSRDKPAQLLIRVLYTLNSYESASLSLSLDEFSNPNSCIPKAGEPFNTVDIHSGNAIRIPISRGTHVATFSVTWPDDAGDGFSDRAAGPGAISFQSSMWLDGLNYRFLTRSFGTEYCQRFTAG